MTETYSLTNQESTYKYSFLNGGGEMGTLTRALDWSKTTLGTPESWPQSLRTTLSIILNSKFPMFLFWGEQHICFYNDAYRPSLGNEGKHPSALGQPGALVWPEIWDFIKPLIDQVLSGQEATWNENQCLPIYRNGKLEDVYWTFSYSPVCDESGSPAGVFVTCTETTQAVIDRRTLLLNQERFSNLMTNAPVAIALFRGPEFIIELANEQVLEYWGRQRHEVMNKPLFEALPEASGQGFEELLTGVYTTGKRFVAKELVVTLKRKGQLAPTYIDFVYEPYRETDGTITGIIVVCVEITDQVLARKLVETSESQMRSLIESAPFPIGVYVGQEMRIQFANSNIINVFGKGPDVIGKRYADLLPELAEGPIFTQLDEVYRTGIPIHSRNQRVDIVVDGKLQPFYFNYSFTPLFDGNGKVYGVMNTAAEITDLVLARQKAENAETTLRGAVELANLGTWELDLTTGISEFSDRLQDWFGIKPGEVITPERGYLPIREADRQRVEQATTYAATPGTDGIYDVEYTLEASSTGQERIIHAQGKAFYTEDGHPYKLTGTAQDVTAERSIQIALEHLVQTRTEELASANEELAAINEKLEASNEELHSTNVDVVDANRDLSRSNQSLEQFAYIASHDMQEPLRKIQQFGDLLKNQYKDQLGEGTLYLDRMQTAASRMSLLIKDLLAYSRISTGQVATESISLNEVVRLVLEDLSVSIEESGAQVEVTPLPTLQGDQTQLSQLFQNLLSNALKFRRQTSSGDAVMPHIIIRANLVQRIELPATLQPGRYADSYHLIEVADNGIGFEQKYADRIFQVFHRLHGKNEFAGTGIGLAIVQKVVTNHGGVITATSQPGKGATFGVYLPV